MKTRVLAADPYPVVLKGIEAAFHRETNCVFVGGAGTNAQAVHKIRRLRPDIAIIEQQLSKIGASSILDILGSEGIATRVVILASTCRGKDVHQAVASGAKGYLIKREPVEILLEAVQRARAGEVMLSNEAQTALQKHLYRQIESEPAAPCNRRILTEREFQILHHTAHGVSITQIAHLLNISASTVKHHRQTLFAKLCASNAPAAVYKAMRQHLL